MNSPLSFNPRLAFLKIIIYAITGLLAFFTLFNVYHQRFQLAIAELIMLIASIILIVKLQKILSSQYASVLTISYTSTIIFAWIFTVILQPLNEMVFFWYFPILVACYALNGANIGFKLTSLISIITIIICYLKLIASSINFSLATWLNTLLPSLAVWSVVHIYEYNNNRMTKKLSKIATHDTLTGLKNRHQVYSVYKEYANQMNSLVLLDIDGLRRINEQQGYLAGDLVLVNVANVLKNAKISDEHPVFRVDGDEFAILLLNTDCKVATNIATVIRNEIAEYKTTLKHDVIQITVSIGIACIESDGYNFDSLLKEANSILQSTKAAGTEYKISASC